MKGPIYTVPWCQSIDRARMPELCGQAVQLTVMVGILSYRLGPVDYLRFITSLLDCMRDIGNPSVLVRGSIFLARELGLIELEAGVVSPSPTLMATRPWWDN